tara:strand:+ start:35 stop:472 length:438 start_codon:yes stop_codon:yes gene_type:complete
MHGDRVAERFLGLPAGHFAAERARKAGTKATAYGVAVGSIAGLILGRFVGIPVAGAVAGALGGFALRARFEDPDALGWQPGDPAGSVGIDGGLVGTDGGFSGGAGGVADGPIWSGTIPDTPPPAGSVGPDPRPGNPWYGTKWGKG